MPSSASDKIDNFQQLERFITPGGHPIDTSQPGLPHYHRKYGDPTPTGLFSFAVGFYLTGLCCLGANGVTNTSVGTGVIFLFLGVHQWAAGWWEMFLGNTYGATLWCSFGGFNMAFGSMSIPWFGVLDAFKLPDGSLSEEYNRSVALFLWVWASMAFMFALGSMRTSAPIFAALIMATVSYILLGVWVSTGSRHAQIAAGVCCVIDASFGLWGALAGFWRPENTLDFIRVPVLELPKKE